MSVPSIEIRIECSSCGDYLHAETEVDRSGDIHIKVEPCQTCMEQAAEAAAEES
jgi:hypothetical protein